jgi:Ca2+-binding EF-hand superfamily protein
MSSVSASGSSNPFAIFQQKLFNKIDSNGDGSITQSELEQAVTTAGGTTQAADALYSQLDPNKIGSVSEQQFSQNLPPPPLSDQMTSQLLGYQASALYTNGTYTGQALGQGSPQSISFDFASISFTSQSGGSGGDPLSQLAQSLFSQIDTGGTGSITKTELEQAVTKAGGTTQAADALYAKLDPNNTGSVSEQQFSQALSQMMPHHHHHHHGADAGNSDSAQGALASLFSTTSGATSPDQLAQSLFSQIDTSGTGSITKTELESAVTKAGGTTQGADALYAQLDPNNTGSVSEQQFAQYLQPPSPTGNTAQDALLALIEDPAQNASTTTSTSSTDTSSSGNTAQDALSALLQSLASNQTASITGNSTQGSSAQDALLSLLESSQSSLFGGSGISQDPLLGLLNSDSGNSTSGLSTSGNTAQDALFALLQSNSASSSGNSSSSSGGNTNSNSNSSTTGTTNNAELALALSLYQNQMSQQMFGSVFGSGGIGA